MQISTRYFVLLGILLLMGFHAQGERRSVRKDSTVNASTGKRYRIAPAEARADRFFIRGDYDRAMKLYERFYSRVKAHSPQQLRMNLKLARLYTLLQRDAQAIRHFDLLSEKTDTSLSVNDVCSYIDALRRENDAQQAEVVARHFAFQYPYSRNQRYLNTLNSLSEQRHYYGKGDSDYSVRMLDLSGPRAEYWIGEIRGRLFYTVSNSPIQDPRKIYYHQTEFFSLSEKGGKLPFLNIPRDLQSGPMVYSRDGRLAIAGNITYTGIDRISKPDGDNGLYVTKLFYSSFDTIRNRWSNFQPLFMQEDGASYAHPVFMDEGRTLLFASDRAGGYGGMDIYSVTWDENLQKWGEPENLGPIVNTEGDEIYPRIFRGLLLFSSNGQEGYGGYDLYRVSYNGKVILPGSLFHYPYPVNTVYNDFGMYISDDHGYFISDRRGETGRDDIYIFDNTISPLSSKDAIGVSSEFSAMAGKLNLIQELASNTQVYERNLTELKDDPTYVLPEADEVLLRVYFDFDNYQLDNESLGLLQELLAMPDIGDIIELRIVGYADEFGSPGYNRILSGKRAEQVAGFFRANGLTNKLCIEGRGRIQLDPLVYKTEILKSRPSADFTYVPELNFSTISGFLSKRDIIRINRQARRVEIIVGKLKDVENNK